MALSDVRARFVQLSGRYDLVNSDDSDNGANWYINKGQRWLDLHPLAPTMYGRYITNLAADDFYIEISGCRALHEVWINDDEDRVLLERKTLKWVQEEFGDVTSDITSGTPTYWCPARPRAVNSDGNESLGTFLDFVVDEDGNETVQGILIAGPPEEEITVDIRGVFFSPTLSDDTDTSWWTENYDDILLLAALRKLESFMRNTAGVKDYNVVIQEELQMLDFAEVEQTVHNITRMTG
jgi:hypothetical protein